MKRQRRLLSLGAVWMLALLLAACSLPTPAPSGPKVTIESPMDGSTAYLGDTIAIRATVDDSRGIAWVQLWIDDRPAGNRYIPTAPVTLLTQDLLWTADSISPNPRIVKVIAQNNAGGQGESKPIGLHVVEASAAAQATALAVQLATATPNPYAVPTPLPTLPYTPLPTPPPTLTPVPTVPTFTPAPTSTALPTVCYDNAVFVADVNVPDGMQFDQGAAFNKTWRLQNYGNCTWDASYQLVFVGGSQMNGPSPAALPQTVPPGGIVDMTVPMVAPNAMGTYTGRWQMRNSSRGNFGPVVDVVIRVNPGPNDAPIISRFDVIPSTIQQGQTATLYWNYINGSFARLIPGGEGGVGPSGSLVVAPSTTTSYQLIVNNSAGTDQRTITLFVQPGPTPVTVPPPPANLAVTAIRSDGFSFIWTDTSANEQGFHLYNADTRQMLVAFGQNTTGGAISGLVCQTPYRFYVTAFNQGGDSYPSNTVEATTGSCGGPPTVLYDFVAQAPGAAWISGAGALTFPGTPGDTRGLARLTASEPLEDGSRPLQALEMDPNVAPGGYVEGAYAVPMALRAGDRVEARVGFLQGVTADATFSILLESGSQVIWLTNFHDTTDGLLKTLTADLSPYAGQTVRIHLRVEAGGQPAQDRAVWVDARLVRP